MIQSEFSRNAASRLAVDGTLYVATDDVPYAHQINEVLEAESMLQNRYAPWPFLSEVAGRTPTGYEEQWRAEGRPMHFFAYCRSPRGSSAADQAPTRFERLQTVQR